jgi:hypothetical protein
MRKLSVFLSFCLFVLGPSLSFPQSSLTNESFAGKIPPIIFEGLHQLANQKPEEAEKAWFHGSPSEGQQRPGIRLRSFLENFGKYENFDPVSAQDITPRLRVLYLALNFENQPIIVKFVVYKTPDAWILLNLKYQIDEEIFETFAPAHSLVN